jgi:hypothetical protein
MKMCVFTPPPVSAAPPRVPEGCISLIAGLLLAVGSFETISRVAGLLRAHSGRVCRPARGWGSVR